MADVVAAVREQLEKAIGRPTITVQPPGGRVLVNFPIIFSAPGQHRTTLDITQPLAGTITADPTYSWDLGAGQTGLGAGHPYTPTVDPEFAANGSPGYYVTATYAKTGPETATLTLTWDATIRLGAGATALDVPLDPITFTATTTFTALSATNRLYAQLP